MDVVVSTPDFKAQIKRKLDKTGPIVKEMGEAYLEHCQFEGIFE